MTKHLSYALTVLLLLGCGQTPAGSGPAAAHTAKPAAAGTPAAQAAPQPPKPVPAQLPDPVARVNGDTIGRTEFERALRTIEGRAGSPVPPDRRDEIFRSVLDQMVAVKLLAQESTARKIEVADADVDARFGQIRQQFPTEQAFTQALAAQQTTADKVKHDIRGDLAVNKMLEQEVGTRVAVTDADVKTFYDQNLDKFKEEEAVRASHILIRVAPDADEAAKKKARAEAEDVLKQVKAGGDFAALAREHSQDGSAAQGGDLNFFTRGQMVPAFETAAFALKPGEVSGIVETQFGLHIIKVTERRPARTVPFTEVTGQIKDYLTSQKREEATSAFVESLKAKGKVEILF